jgi:hypothetical protein
MRSIMNCCLPGFISLSLLVVACDSSDPVDQPALGNGGSSSSSSSSGGGGAGGSGSGSGSGSGGGGGGVVEDFDMAAADFTCLLSLPKVRRFRITNMLGHESESLAVANAPGMSDYPVGTLIQLVPVEAMVKRRKGFSPASNDWEYFFLDVAESGTTIVSRGTTDVVNRFGGNCQSCHEKAEPKWDFVCENDHGCDTIPVTPEQIEQAQAGDPRCPSSP